MKLPNYDRAVVSPEKLQNYLLSQSHPIGCLKAKFFLSLGYTQDNWTALETSIRALLENDVQKQQATEYGTKYEVRGAISGPSGGTAELVTAWIILKGEDFPRFITAYPGDR